MLKSFLAFSLIGLSLSSFAVPDYDGCYELQIFPEKHPVICITGTLEEGNGGAEARAFAYDPYWDEGTCIPSTGLIMNETEFALLLEDYKVIQLTNFETPAALAGDLTLFDETTPFKKLSESASGPFVEAARRADCI